MGGERGENDEERDENGATTTTTTTTTTRIYVGGLGATVTADDLRHTFSSLGKLESVEIVRTQGRSFAYLDFLPSSPNSLSKLFSTYNGCKWKGGRLRLEKAKEHYLVRLRREWAEPAKLANNAPSNAATENTHSPKKLNNVLKPEKMEVKLFFPKLRKVKALPFKGTGKHKYSFQRVEVPPLPIHFCDCEEHSDLSHTAKGNNVLGLETQGGGIDEKELDMMKLVMNKLFERECVLEAGSRGDGLVKEVDNATKSVDDDLLVDDESETDHMTDEDNLVMNFVAGGKNKTALSESWGLETIVANERAVVNELRTSKDKPSGTVPKRSEGRKIVASDKKRKSPLIEEADGNNGFVSTKKAYLHESGLPIESESGREYGLVKEEDNATKSVDDDLLVDDDNETDPMTDEDNLVMNMVSGRKYKAASSGSWGQETTMANKGAIVDGLRTSKDKPSGNVLKSSERRKIVASDKKRKLPLTEEADGNGFVSAKKTDLHESAQPIELESGIRQTNTKLSWSQKSAWRELAGERGNNAFSISQILQSTAPPNVEESKSGSVSVPNLTEGQNQNIKEPEELAVTQSNELNTDLNNYARGAAWLQKSSWTQLVSGTNSSFSISQLLPGMTFQKQEVQPKSLDAANSTVSKYGKLVESGSSAYSEYGSKASDSSNMVAFATALDPVPSPQQKSLQTFGETDEIIAPKKNHSTPAQPSVRKYPIGERGTCSFMRSDASMKEWMKAKAALSGTLKKKNNEQES